MQKHLESWRQYAARWFCNAKHYVHKDAIPTQYQRLCDFRKPQQNETNACRNPGACHSKDTFFQVYWHKIILSIHYCIVTVCERVMSVVAGFLAELWSVQSTYVFTELCRRLSVCSWHSLQLQTNSSIAVQITRNSVQSHSSLPSLLPCKRWRWTGSSCPKPLRTLQETRMCGTMALYCNNLTGYCAHQRTVMQSIDECVTRTSVCTLATRTAKKLFPRSRSDLPENIEILHLLTSNCISPSLMHCDLLIRILLYHAAIACSGSDRMDFLLTLT